MPTYVSLAEFARDRRVTRQSVHEWVRKYSIPLVDRKLDLDVGRMQWEVHRKRRPARSAAPESAVKPPAEGGSESGDGSGYWASKTRREAAEAAIAEFKLAELAGTLVLREEVNRTLFGAARVMRDQMLAIAPRLAATLSAVSDPALIEARISDEVRVGLAAFAQQLRAGGHPDVSHEQPC